ncbi:MAG: TetR family transcriptional regulator [Bifidobacteriaceae bacterium]|jgi:AcrR family transcriptional regulator|nr:TetR family transcriptional regulator [Bifidobacteriaceae bacterium]
MSQSAPVRPGRRPGNEPTAEVILHHAREFFAAKGYAHTSLRAVAEAARVDPAMIAYFFGSKAGLFQAAIRVPISLNMPAMIEFRASNAEPAERVARFFFSLWADPPVAQALTAIILEAGINSAAGRALRHFMWAYVGGPIMQQAKADNPEVRLRMAVGLMGGVALQRRFDRGSVLAALTLDQVVAVVGPTLRHILTAPLPDGLPADSGELSQAVISPLFHLVPDAVPQSSSPGPSKTPNKPEPPDAVPQSSSPGPSETPGEPRQPK